MTPVRLWTWDLSPFPGKVRLALAEKGIEAEMLEIHPVRRPARLRELNPVNRVPVLEVDGTALRESSVICEYLEETHPEPALWPVDAALRGWARGWLSAALSASRESRARRRARRGHPCGTSLHRAAPGTPAGSG